MLRTKSRVIFSTPVVEIELERRAMRWRPPDEGGNDISETRAEVGFDDSGVEIYVPPPAGRRAAPPPSNHEAPTEQWSCKAGMLTHSRPNDVDYLHWTDTWGHNKAMKYVPMSRRRHIRRAIKRAEQAVWKKDVLDYEMWAPPHEPPPDEHLDAACYSKEELGGWYEYAEVVTFNGQVQHFEI